MCRECGCGPIHDEREYGRSRRLLTKAEKVEKLKIYAEGLKEELKAVEEHVKELEA